LIYINDLPKILINSSIPALFADDTSVTITNSNPTDFQKDIRELFEHLNEWFNLNLLLLNFYKTNFIHFKTRNMCGLDIKVQYDNRFIANMYYTRFFGLTIDNTLYWKTHIDQLLPELSTACYATRIVKSLMTQETLVMIYYAYLHSSMNYAIIFWGNSSYSINIFRLQKKATGIITNTRNRYSCRALFNPLKTKRICFI
jgi:hypothetical protein